MNALTALKVKLAKKNREVNPKSWEELYRALIVCGIRKNVAPTVNEENAVLRKTLAQVIAIMIKNANLTEKQAYEIFAEFYNYNDEIEQCKADVKNELGIN